MAKVNTGMSSHLHTASGRPALPLHATLPAPVAGAVAGIVAGAAYLIAQCSLAATVLGGEASEPLQRIAAMLMGPDAAPPPAEFNATLAGMGLMIHFFLAVVFGRLVTWVVGTARPLRAVLVGGAVGLALFLVNFWLVAPSMFPWFEASRHVVTAADHWLFGACAGLVGAHLRAP